MIARVAIAVAILAAAVASLLLMVEAVISFTEGDWVGVAGWSIVSLPLVGLTATLVAHEAQR